MMQNKETLQKSQMAQSSVLKQALHVPHMRDDFRLFISFS